MPITQEQFEAFLRGISDCFMESDFDAWRNIVELPFSLVTAKGPVVLEDEAALRENFNLYLNARDVMRIDTVYRLPLELEDCGDGHWLGTYETRMISAGGLAVPVYVSTAMLKEVEGQVKLVSILNARGHSDWMVKRD